MLKETGISIKDGQTLSEKKKDQYQHLVGKLIYLILTRLDITYSFNIISQFYAYFYRYSSSCCRKNSMLFEEKFKKGTFLYCDNIDIKGYADTNWAGSINNK